jgi:hypothetical protein
LKTPVITQAPGALAAPAHQQNGTKSAVYPAEEYADGWVPGPDDREYYVIPPRRRRRLPPPPKGLGPDDRDYYPTHEEDHMPEGARHYRQKNYLKYAWEILKPGQAAFADLSVHHTRDDRQRYIAPDMMGAAGPTEDPEPNSYMVWRDPPILFAAEVLSKYNTRPQVDACFERYAQRLKVPELVVIEGRARQKKYVELYRLEGEQYVLAPADPEKGCWSEEFGVWLRMDEDGFVWAFLPDGTRIPSEQEVHDRAVAAEAQAAAAEAQAVAEAERAATAEAQAVAEAERAAAAEAQAAAAEAQAAAEAKRAAAAEAQAAAEADLRRDSEREIQRLLARLRELEG